jgi:hypothetical protein
MREVSATGEEAMTTAKPAPTLIAEVMEHDARATKGPWLTRGTNLIDVESDILDLTADDATLIAHYREACPELARRLGEAEADLCTERDRLSRIAEAVGLAPYFGAYDPERVLPRVVELVKRLREAEALRAKDYEDGRREIHRLESQLSAAMRVVEAARDWSESQTVLDNARPDWRPGQLAAVRDAHDRTHEALAALDAKPCETKEG